MLDSGVREKVIIHCKEAGFCLDKSGEFTAVGSLKVDKSLFRGSVGAGDAFCAGALIGIYNCWADIQIMEFASACAVMALGSADATSGMKTLQQTQDFCSGFSRRETAV